MENSPKFKAGDKVEIVQGGWGVSRKKEGCIVTIHSSRYIQTDKRWQYQILEYDSLSKEDVITPTGWVDEMSFELVSSSPELIPVQEKKLLKLTYGSISIDLDPGVDFSRKFAEVFLNLVYERNE